MKNVERLEKGLPILLGGILFFLPFLTELNTQDIWFHSSIGRWIVENLSLPDTGIFSLTRMNQEWMSHSWLSQLLLYGIVEFLGPLSLYLLKIMLIGLTFIFLIKIIESLKFSVLGRSFIYFFVGLQFLQINYSLRTQVIIQLFLVWYMFRHLSGIKKNFKNLLFDYCFIIIVINFHAFSVFLLILFCFFWSPYIFRKLKEEWSVPIAVLLIGILFLIYCSTPYGFSYWEYLYLGEGTFGLEKKVLAREWMSPFKPINYLNFESIGYFMIIPWGLYSLIVNFKRKDSKNSFFIIFGLTLGALAARLVPFSAMIVIPGLVTVKHPEKWKKYILGGVATASFGILISSILFGITMNLRGERIKLGLGLNHSFYPEKALKLLSPLKKVGPVFSSMRWGGVLMWNNFQPIIDQRFELYSMQAKRESITAFYEVKDLQKIVDTFKPVAILAGTIDSPMIFNTVKGLNPQYKLSYFDDVSAIFIRDKLILPEGVFKCASLVVTPDDNCGGEWERLLKLGGKSNLLRLKMGEDIDDVLSGVGFLEWSAIQPFVLYNLIDPKLENRVRPSLCRHINWKYCF